MIKPIVIRAQRQERTMRAVTGMSIRQFNELCVLFKQALLHEAYQKPRKRCIGGGRKNTLYSIEEKVFFILFYLKVYPTYDIAALFCSVNRSQTCRWVKKLLPMLEKTLGYSVSLPKRKICSVSDFQALFPEVVEVIMDVTERKCQRPASSKNLKRRYSGKQKSHTRKNTLIVDKEKHIRFLSNTKNGRFHDLTLFKKEAIAPCTPDGFSLFVDKGYTGISSLLPEQVNVCIPKKKRKNKKLTSSEKADNQIINSLRIPVEHAIGGMKRYGCMQVPIRNKSWDMENQFPLLCAGLWNFHLDRK